MKKGETIMKKIEFVLGAIIVGMLFTACEKTSDNESVNQTKQSEITAPASETFCAEENGNTLQANKEFLVRELEVSDSDAEGIAYRLEKCECGLIVEWKDKVESDNAYLITFVNDKGEEYYTSIDSHGSIGPIKDSKGNYIYAPID